MAASDITVAGLAATGDVKGVKLNWTYSDPRNNALPNIGLDMVEVHASATNDRAAASKVGEGITDFLHAGLSRGDVRYYWVKARDYLGGYGAWYPSSSTGGIVGTEASNDVSIGLNGYWKHPSGLIEQWGFASFTAGVVAVTFPIAFPNAALNAVVTFIAGASSVATAVVTIQSISQTTLNMCGTAVSNSAGPVSAIPNGTVVCWRATGY